MEIWIASHMNTYERLEKFKQCIQSLFRLYSNNNSFKIVISMSFENDSFKEQVLNFLDKSITIYCHETKLHQFSHYYYLWSIKRYEKNHRIMFMDDDDLLIDFPPEFNTQFSVSSNQYLCDHTSTYNELINNNLSEYDTDRDFSGYSCFLNQLDNYFTNEHHKLHEIERNFEDIHFMRYIDALEGNLQARVPYIFHRYTGHGDNWVPKFYDDVIKYLVPPKFEGTHLVPLNQVEDLYNSEVCKEILNGEDTLVSKLQKIKTELQNYVRIITETNDMSSIEDIKIKMKNLHYEMDNLAEQPF